MGLVCCSNVLCSTDVVCSAADVFNAYVVSSNVLCSADVVHAIIPATDPRRFQQEQEQEEEGQQEEGQQEDQQEKGQQEEGQQEEKVSNEPFNRLTQFCPIFSVPFMRTVTRWESYNMCTDDLLGKRHLCIQIVSVTVPFRLCCDPKCKVRI